MKSIEKTSNEFTERCWYYIPLKEPGKYLEYSRSAAVVVETLVRSEWLCPQSACFQINKSVGLSNSVKAFKKD